MGDGKWWQNRNVISISSTVENKYFFRCYRLIYLGRHNFKKLLTQIKQTSNLKVIAGTALGTKGQLGVQKEKQKLEDLMLPPGIPTKGDVLNNLEINNIYAVLSNFERVMRTRHVNMKITMIKV